MSGRGEAPLVLVLHHELIGREELVERLAAGVGAGGEEFWEGPMIGEILFHHYEEEIGGGAAAGVELSRGVDRLRQEDISRKGKKKTKMWTPPFVY
jgi:hypothetical protein